MSRLLPILLALLLCSQSIAATLYPIQLNGGYNILSARTKQQLMNALKAQ